MDGLKVVHFMHTERAVRNALSALIFAIPDIRAFYRCILHHDEVKSLTNLEVSAKARYETSVKSILYAQSLYDELKEGDRAIAEKYAQDIYERLCDMPEPSPEQALVIATALEELVKHKTFAANYIVHGYGGEGRTLAHETKRTCGLYVDYFYDVAEGAIDLNPIAEAIAYLKRAKTT